MLYHSLNPSQEGFRTFPTEISSFPFLGKDLCNLFIFPLIVFEVLLPIWAEVGEKDIDVKYHIYLVVGSDDCSYPDRFLSVFC